MSKGVILMVVVVSLCGCLPPIGPPPLPGVLEGPSHGYEEGVRDVIVRGGK